jgi:hypothetical protein
MLGATSLFCKYYKKETINKNVNELMFINSKNCVFPEG